jgi:hypothetical protein
MDWNFERVKGMGDCIGGSLTSRQRAFVVSFVPIGCLRWGWGGDQVSYSVCAVALMIEYRTCLLKNMTTVLETEMPKELNKMSVQGYAWI